MSQRRTLDSEEQAALASAWAVLGESPPARGQGFAPPAQVRRNARQGLRLRQANVARGRSRPGATEVGVARAVQLALAPAVGKPALRRMRAYFARHAIDARAPGWGVDSPGWVAWLCWGGNEGWAWAERELARENPSSLLDSLDRLRSQLAAAAQAAYAEWAQDGEGYDEALGAGGICQDVAEAMVGVLVEAGIDAMTVDNQGMGDQHVWVVAWTADEAFVVDIPPHVYETGGGYTWRKRSDVTIEPTDVMVEEMNRADLGDDPGEG